MEQIKGLLSQAIAALRTGHPADARRFTRKAQELLQGYAVTGTAAQ